MSGVAAVINARDASADDGVAAAAVRVAMLENLAECASMRELTRTTTTQSTDAPASSRSTAPSSASTRSGRCCSRLALARAAAQLGAGLDSDASDSFGAVVPRRCARPTRCSSRRLGRRRRRRAAAARRERAPPAWFGTVANVSAMTEAVCSAALALAYFGGAKTHVAQPRFTLLCERETPERSDALALALDGDTAELVLPANFSGDARLASASYVDYRLAHFDRNVFVGGAASLLADRELNSGVATAGAHAHAGPAVGFAERLARAPRSSPALVTVAASVKYDLVAAELVGACGDGAGAATSITFACPLGDVEIECDADAIPYALTMTCPKYVPACVAWAWDAPAGWRGAADGPATCKLANYTADNDDARAATACSTSTPLVTNVTEASWSAETTPRPTETPTPAPSSPPSLAPTTPAPSLAPTPAPTPAPSVYVELTMAVSVGLSGFDCSSYDDASAAVLASVLTSSIAGVGSDDVTNTACASGSRRLAVDGGGFAASWLEGDDARGARRLQSSSSTIAMGVAVSQASVSATSGAELSRPRRPRSTRTSRRARSRATSRRRRPRPG